MRILHVIPFLWSGAGNVLTRLCESQARENDVGIVTSGVSKGLKDWTEYRKRLKQANVQHFAIDFFDRDPAVFWPSVEAFAELVRKWRPDLIHCHSGVPACAVALSGSRFIAQLHSWGVGRPEWMNRMDLAGFRRADRMICGSIAYQKILTEGGVQPERIRYLPWGIDLKTMGEKWGQTPITPFFGVQKWGNRGLTPFFRFGFLGRIEPRKCQLDLARAFHRFHRRYPQSRLELIGPVADEIYGRDLRQFISKSGLSRAVKLKGRVADPFPKVRTWNVFTSLSSDEGQGMAALEAMALGTPVLGRRVAGIEDFLHDGHTGLAVTSAQPGEVTDRMEWAFHHPAKLTDIARCAREMVEKNYNWDRTIENISSLYETVTRPNQ